MERIDKYTLPEHMNRLYTEEAASSIALARDVADKVNEIIDTLNKFATDDITWKQEQNGRINKAVLYMKDNLLNSLNELMVLLRDSGFIDDRIAYHCEELNSRLDALFKLVTPGSTTMDAEVIDIRTDIHGKIHACAGDAVRALGKLVAKIDQALAEIAPAEFDGVEKDTIYSYAYPAGLDLANHNTYYKAVSPGDVFYITTYVVNSAAYRVAMFFAGDVNVGDVGKYEEVGGYVENYKIVIPDGVNKIRVTCRAEYTPILYTGGITERNIPAALADLENALAEYIPEEFDGVEENKVYSFAQQTGLEYDGHNTYYKAVSPGDVFYITTYVVNSAAYRVAMFYNGDTYVGDVGRYEVVGGYVENYKIVIPDGVNKIRVTCRAEYTPELTRMQITKTNIPEELKKVSGQAHRNYVSFKNGICKVKAKYNGEQDIVFTISQRGGNNLPDLWQVDLVNNPGSLNSDLTPDETLFTSATDLFSPHIVSAVNNADGDNPESGYFTGGNHRSNNTGSGGAANARCEFLKVSCDNVPVSGSAYGNEITVRWRNYIQGYNTQKEDGTGREILQEDITLTICGTQINAEIRHTALEDIIRKRYYGLQMVSRAYSTFECIDGKNNVVYETGAQVAPTGKTYREIRLTKGTDVLRIEIDPVGLGDFAWNALTHNAFNVETGKCYFNLVYTYAGYTQNAGEVTTARGYYKFTSEA